MLCGIDTFISISKCIWCSVLFAIDTMLLHGKPLLTCQKKTWSPRAATSPQPHSLLEHRYLLGMVLVISICVEAPSPLLQQSLSEQGQCVVAASDSSPSLTSKRKSLEHTAKKRRPVFSAFPVLRTFWPTELEIYRIM